MSGGVSVNDGLIHAGLHALPFGGIGNSGMGHYHGYEGFTTFSKTRPVFRQGPIRPLNLLLPPYEKGAFKLLNLVDAAPQVLIGAVGASLGRWSVASRPQFPTLRLVPFCFGGYFCSVAMVPRVDP